MVNRARAFGGSVVAFVACVGGASTLSEAAITSAHSEGYGVRAGVFLLSNHVGINVGPTSYSSGTSPNAYNDSDVTASVSATVPIVGSLSTGIITSGATSDVDFGDTAGTVTGRSQVAGAALRIVPGLLPTLDVVNVSSTTIGSNASVSHNGSNFVVGGGMLIENLAIRVAGVGLLKVNANAAPNTVLLDLLGIRIVLNEQIQSVVGNTASMEVNALRISIAGTPQIVGADVVIGHSSAMMTVPTPASATLLCGAVGLIGSRRRRAV
jgi:xanthosine utilization system XapX-like protein